MHVWELKWTSLAETALLWQTLYVSLGWLNLSAVMEKSNSSRVRAEPEHLSLADIELEVSLREENNVKYIK